MCCSSLFDLGVIVCLFGLPQFLFVLCLFLDSCGLFETCVCSSPFVLFGFDLIVFCYLLALGSRLS